MFILSDIGLFLFTSIFMYVIYFLIRSALTFRALSFLHVSQHLVTAASGFLLGLAIVFVKYIDTAIDPNFSVPLFVIVPLVLLLFTNLNTTLYSILVSIIGYLIQNDVHAITYVIVSTFLFIIVVYLLLNFILKKSIVFISYFGAVVAITLLSYLIIEFATDTADLRTKIEAEIMMGPAFILIYIPYMILARISESTDSLFESANFVYDGYIRKSFMKESVNKYIKDKKITKGLYVIFNPVDKTGMNDYDVEEIKVTILKKVKSILGDNSILFELENDNFGFFRKIDLTRESAQSIRDSNQALLEKEILDVVNTPYKTTRDKTIIGNLSFAFSVYGIDENSVDKLEDNALHVLKNNKVNNDHSIKYYEFSKVKSKAIDSTNVKKLDEWIGLENFSNNYYPIINKEEEQIALLVKTEKKWEFDVSDNVDDLVRYNMWYSTFERYFATIAIKDKANNKLFIYYSNSLDSDFDIENFEKNIIKHGKKKEDLVFVIKEKLCSKSGLKTIKAMREKGFFFAIELDTNDVNYAMNFDYVIYSGREFKSTKFKNAIYFNLGNKAELSEAFENGYDYSSTSIVNV
ncbi:MAG: hypothetical protein KAG91_02645 [Mycoplasmataceae bacterium]|nr:hypothetical protein [Mycoplasmataceae bacterium]